MKSKNKSKKENKIVRFEKQTTESAKKSYSKIGKFFDERPNLKAYITAFTLNAIISLFAFNISMMVPYTISFVPYIVELVLVVLIAICVTDVIKQKVFCVVLMPFTYLNIYMLVWFADIATSSIKLVS